MDYLNMVEWLRGWGAVLAGKQGDRYKTKTDKYKNDSFVVLFVLIRF